MRIWESVREKGNNLIFKCLYSLHFLSVYILSSLFSYFVYETSLRLESGYPYEGKDVKCRTRGKPTALSHAKVSSYKSLDKGERDEHLIQVGHV